MLTVPSATPASIVLTTLNAKYIHASLGLRYLLANMGDLRTQTVLREFTIARQPQDVVDELLSSLNGAPKPQIVGFGIYIWNVAQTTTVVRLLALLQTLALEDHGQPLRIRLVINRERRTHPQRLVLRPQNSHACRVERRDPHATGDFAAHQVFNSFAHLCSSLIREGDRENLAGPGLSVANQLRNAVREHAGLA